MSGRAGIASVLLLPMLATLGAAWVRAGEETIRLADGPGRELTSAFCATCHSLDYIPMNADVFDRSGWEKSVRKMIDRFGAPIPEEEARRILDYLAENY